MAKTNYLKFFPKPLLDDFLQSNVLPIIGAGFSKNAILPPRKKMLDWNELGKAIAEELIDYHYSTPIEAISAYSHEYSRIKLIEKLNELLLINSIKPGDAHIAFCNVPFKKICTTNYDFLLEDAYKQIKKPFMPITNENQLAMTIKGEMVSILKFHGDIHHPDNLVATEEDYDNFLLKNPIFSTYLMNLLITMTPIFIGYSLDDVDLRQIWQLIKNRLGSLKRPAYVIKVNCSSYEKASYDRRGVKVINIIEDKATYPKVLKSIFDELSNYNNELYLTDKITGEDTALAELALPTETNNRLCFISASYNLLSFYKKYVFPVIRDCGLVPIMEDDMITAGDNLTAKISALMRRSEFIIVDVSTEYSFFELGTALSLDKNILVIQDVNQSNSIPLKVDDIILRDSDPYKDIDPLTESIRCWIQEKIEPLRKIYLEEPKRLLAKNEYNAAIISAITQLEIKLLEAVSTLVIKKPDSIYKGANSLISYAFNLGVLNSSNHSNLKKWIYLRNNLVHKKVQRVNKATATEIVYGIAAIVSTIETKVSDQFRN